MCCHTGMPCHRQRTWHPTPSQYTTSGPTCHCTILWRVMLHWNTQLPILLSWVRPDREIFPRASTHAANIQLYDADVVAVSQKLSRKCTVPSESWTWDQLAPDLWRILSTPHSKLDVFECGNPECGVWILSVECCISLWICPPPNFWWLISNLHLKLKTQLRVFEWGIFSVEGFTFHAQDSSFKYMVCGVPSIRHRSGTCSMWIHYAIHSATDASPKIEVTITQ